jgi:hypothetical protein
MHFNFIFIKLECSGLVLYVKFTGETMYHLLMHCVVANELWSRLFCFWSPMGGANVSD